MSLLSHPTISVVVNLSTEFINDVHVLDMWWSVKFIIPGQMDSTTKFVPLWEWAAGSLHSLNLLNFISVDFFCSDRTSSLLPVTSFKFPINFFSDCWRILFISFTVLCISSLIDSLCALISFSLSARETRTFVTWATLSLTSFRSVPRCDNVLNSS